MEQKNVTAVQLFPLSWKAIGILEDRCKLAVVAVTSDGAASNRTYRMHSKLQRADEFSCHVVYKTLNPFSDEIRYFICDPPRIIKTTSRTICLIQVLVNLLDCYGMMVTILLGIIFQELYHRIWNAD